MSRLVLKSLLVAFIYFACHGVSGMYTGNLLCAQPQDQEPEVVLTKGDIAKKFKARRYWSDDTGEHRVQASLYAIHENGVRLKKTNRIVVFVPFSRLGFREQAYIESIVRLHEPKWILTSTRPQTSSNTYAIRSKSKATTLRNNARSTRSSSPSWLAESSSTEYGGWNGGEFQLQIPVTSLKPGTGSRSNDSSLHSARPAKLPTKNVATLSNSSTSNSGSLPALPSSLKGKPESQAAQKDTEPRSIEKSPRLSGEFDGAIMRHLHAIQYSSSPTECQIALDALANYQGAFGEDRLKILRNVTSNQNPDCRQKALKALSVHDPIGSLPLALEALNDNERVVRMEAIRFLKRSPSPKTMDTLIELLRSSDRAVASLLLLDYGTACQEKVARLLKDEDSAVREKACELLGKVGNLKIIPQLRTTQRTDTNRVVQRYALAAINQIRVRAADK